MAIDHQLNRDLARIADASSLDVPIGFLVIAALLNVIIRFFIEQGCDRRNDLNRTGLRELQLASVLAHGYVVDTEVQNMALAITDVIAALADAFTPAVVVEFTVEL